MYRLAESYLPPAACLKPILTALSAFKSRDIDLDLLTHVYSLPAGLLERPSLGEITAACRHELMVRFGDVPSVITDLEHRGDFCALPFAAVLEWLQSDDLKVHSESCVLFLLSAWVNSEEHPACSLHQQRQLAHTVRVGQLSPTYLNSVLPDLKWFQGSCSSEEGRLVRALQVRSGHAGASCSPWPGPAAWISDKRRRTVAQTSVCLEWSLGAGDIATIDSLPRGCVLDSPGKAYSNGIFYELYVSKVAEAKGDPAVTLGFCLRVACGSMNHVLESWNPDEQPCLFRAELWVPSCTTVGTTRQLHNVCTGSGSGVTNLLGRSGATIAEVVAPFLKEGRLSLKAVIKA